MSLRHTPLVPSDQLAASRSYRQLARRGADEDFRRELSGLVPGRSLIALSRTIAAEGAVSLTGLTPPADFDRFRRVYDGEMRAMGSRGPLHSYLNITSSTPLMRSPGLWETIAHPLYVVLVAYALGGPVKIIDLRSKDTQPLDVVARDNTLHLDNSPFIDEYKVVATWTLGTAEGPSGQGLTYLPGTNKLFRNCFVESDGSVWSDEDACIFPTGARVDEVLEVQAAILGEAEPAVVHLAGLDMPCSTIFAASRVVHHRYRTAAGSPRSSLMATFHRVDDGAELLNSTESPFSPLHRFLLTGGSREAFMAAVAAEKDHLTAAMDRLIEQPELVVDARRHLLTGPARDDWYARQHRGVTLNGLRSSRMAQYPDRVGATHDWLVQRLLHDLQGPLNMPFFSDLRETRRRRARIWIREMSSDNVSKVVRTADVYSSRAAGASDRPATGTVVADLHTSILELGYMLSKAPLSGATPSGIGDEFPGSADEVVIGSLSPFVGDLEITVSWLDGTDPDSVLTATAFALLAAALGAGWFALGDAGWRLAARLRRQYLALVADSPAVEHA
ncbi:hypothetical protein M8542_48035 [Amycolatopsis sp. OK19-0408]|uniref:Uncharacterized protein n=1 Tax=Amycolatopsis iheyensis TaxID=2945988 RepID=A0A9X2NPJ3_9PSEU|nr:hypothetical protein [Amycolatopsis iheyensis]MCR6490577.1 hypothetical protein [Amycolatopsis iheyensis]